MVMVNNMFATLEGPRVTLYQIYYVFAMRSVCTYPLHFKDPKSSCSISTTSNEIRLHSLVSTCHSALGF